MAKACVTTKLNTFNLMQLPMMMLRRYKVDCGDKVVEVLVMIRMISMGSVERALRVSISHLTASQG